MQSPSSSSSCESLINLTISESSEEEKFKISIDIYWEKLNLEKQSVFPIENNEIYAGLPKDLSNYTVRTWINKNFNPGFLLKVTKGDKLYKQEQLVQLSLIKFTDGSPLPLSKDPIQGNKRLVFRENDEYFCRVKGQLYFPKFRTLLCSEKYGLLVLKAKVVGENSTLKGCEAVSQPFEIMKAPQRPKLSTSPQILNISTSDDEKSKSKNSNLQHSDMEESDQSSESEDSENKKVSDQMQDKTVFTYTQYPGCDEIIKLLRRIGLTKYIINFLRNEIDMNAFTLLTEQNLIEMGITKVGPRVKILEEIASLTKIPRALDSE